MPNPNRLVDVDESEALFPRANLSRDDYDDWKRLNTTLSSLDVYGGTGFLLRTGSVSEPVPAARVSDGFFRTLGVAPMLGRDFRPGEDKPGQREDRDPHLRDVDEALWRPPRFDRAVDQPDRRSYTQLLACYRRSFVVCAARRRGILGAPAGQDRL